MQAAKIIPPLTEKPAHVPAELVRDVDIFNLPGAREDVHLAWKRIQMEMPRIFWTPRNGGLWMLTRAADVLEYQKDHETFSLKGALVPNHPRPFPAPPIDVEDAEHAPWRLLLSPAFSPKKVAEAEAMVRKVTIEAIEGFNARGECEFVREFTRILPIVVFLTMMGLPPEDKEELLPLADVIVTSSTPEKLTEARMALMAYIQKQVNERKINPKDDLITQIMNAKIKGEPIEERYAVGMLTLALSGGLDTVKNMLGFCCLFLATHPDHVRQLRENPDLIPNAVEELFRRHGVSNTARLVRKDCEFAGVHLKKGDQIQGVSSMVGLDDETVPDPMTVDFNRPMPIPHATFGNGPHRCPGSILAKREVVVWLQEWLPRIPEFRVKPGTVPRQNAGMVNNVAELWLSWDAAKTA
ncbi:cytochrome P450 [Noviherbaspirillum sedimenti]|uniref:Cytochrome P450 n=1 Tax=Noviherbaspirillum sedimenti TaxID=2320865 RepID=A0A3A3GEF0_9BURK|nr:cytochrome P450 [Noviherbaspirillum sedimenti]RJG00606.1 cytochrome P450 [Noviherbaspirillum sedimenti]